MTNLPLLSLLIGLPLLGALVLGLGQLKEQARTIAIGLSTLQLALLGYIYSALVLDFTRIDGAIYVKIYARNRWIKYFPTSFNGVNYLGGALELD
jgi:NADH:ubiquinone oxidoreductase subunit 4 (subunit M)